MKPRSIAIAAASLAALALPSLAVAADDGDVLANDPASITTVFSAGGGAADGTFHGGERAFVASLLAQHAAAGVLREDTSHYLDPRTQVRTGFSHPATALAPLQRLTLKAARGKLVARYTQLPDGSLQVERGLARDIATGALRRVSIDDARRFSADPLRGRAGVAYAYALEIQPAAAG